MLRTAGGPVALAAVAGCGGGAAADVPLWQNRLCSGLLGGTGGRADGRRGSRFGYSTAADAKRRGMVRVQSDTFRSPYVLTDEGRELLAAMTRRAKAA